MWLALLGLLVFVPEVYDLSLPPLSGSGRLIFLVALSVLLVAFSAGVVRRSRWIFWLMVVAFLAGAIRVPFAVLQLAGLVPFTGPAWYVALQGAIGAVQLLVGVALVVGYRKAGVWGAF